jgi:hypothetical protein
MVVSALLNTSRDPGAAQRYRSVIDGRSVVISFDTRHRAAVRRDKAGWGEIRRRSLEGVLARLVVLQPDDDLMRTCATLRATCSATGRALGQKAHERRSVDRSDRHRPGRGADFW